MKIEKLRGKYVKIMILTVILTAIACAVLITQYPNHLEVIKGIFAVKSNSEGIGRSIASIKG